MSLLRKKIKRFFFFVKRVAYELPSQISNLNEGVKYLLNNPQLIFVIIRNAPKRSYKWFTATRRRKILSSILAALILLTSVRWAFFQPKETLAWFNDNWQFRKKIIINNPGSQQTNYPVDISMGSLGSHQIRSDCADIRVADVNGLLTTNPFWVDCAASTSPTVWVKFSTLPAGSTVVYIYYGNPQANNISSSIDNVVTYGHDFTGQTIDTTKVTQAGGSSYQNDYFTLLNNSDAWDTYVYAASSQTRTADLVFQAKFKAESGARAMVGWHDNGSGSSNADLIYAIYFNNGTWDVYEDGNDRVCGLCTTYTVGTWYDIKIVLKATGATYYTKLASASTWTQIYDSAYSSETPLKPGAVHYDANENSYTDSWVVLTQAATLPSLSIGSEEYAPGPVAFYKFDEGYSAPESLPITKNEQQINILNQEFKTPVGDSNVYPTDNSLGIIKWDGTKYSDATVYFEAVLRSTVGSDNTHAVLYTTGGSAVAGSDIYSASTGFVRLRSSPLTLVNGTEYTVRAYNNGGNGGRQAIVRSARLIVVQNNPSRITNSETQVDIGNAEGTTSSTATQLTDKKIYYYDATKFSPDPTVYFEASLRAPQPTIEQQINIVDQSFTSTPGSSTPVPTDNSVGLVLWDANKYPNATVYFEAVLTNNVGSDPGHAVLYTEGGSAVSGADVQMNSTGNYVRVRSSALTLTDDTRYTVRAYAAGGNGSRTATVKAARLIVIQSDSTKITDTETQIELGNAQNNFSNTSYSTLTDHKIYYYDSTKFSGSVSAYFEASIHTDSGSDTVYAQLLECTSSTDCGTGSAVSGSEVSYTGNTNWTLPTRAAVTLTSGKYYAVQTKVSAGTGDIANAKIIIDQTAAGGITALETVHQYINTLATDTDNVYTSQNFNNRFNPDLNESQISFSGGTFTYYFDATIKTSAGTGYAQMYDKTDSVTISSSEITTTSTTYARAVSSNITSNLPQYPSTPARNLDTQVKNSAASGNTTSVSSSRLMIQVTNLATSATTAYADLYNLTDTAQVTSSEISTNSNSWSLSRSSAITLATGKQYVVRIRSSSNGSGIKIASAKIILNQSSGSGITNVETYQQMVNFAVTDTDSTYTDQDFLNQFNKDNYHTSQSTAYFEATLKTSAGTGYAQLKNDTSGSAITGSEVTTTSATYERKRSGELLANLPASAANMDAQAKNSATNTSTVSNSWLIIQNSRSYNAVTHDATQNQLHGNTSGITWKTSAGCHSQNCLSFDGTDDYVKVYDDGKLDFAASDNFTLTGWFKHIQQTSGTDVILAKHGTSGSDGGYKVYMESDGDISFGVDDDDTWGPDDAATSTAATYDDNSWHHFAAVKTGTTKIDLYIDGALVNTDNTIAATGTLANNDHLYIGIDGDGTSNPWQGSLDEIKVYPYARTQADINTDYSLGSTARGTSTALGIKDESFLSNGLVGYWKMDESSGNATDSSGNNLTLTNQSSVSYTAGKFGNAPDFVPASTDYFSTTTDINGIQTISFWVYPDSVTSNYFISFSDSVYISVSSGTLTANGFTGTFYVNGLATATLATSAWQLVTVTTPTSINAADTYLGRVGTTANYMDGKLDEVRLYNRALSPAEVSQLYAWAPGPVAYWKMDENTGSTYTYDSSENGYTGDITNAVYRPGKFGSAFYFDGNTDYVDFNDNLDMGANDAFTIEMWFMPTVDTAGSETASLISKKLGYSSVQPGYSIIWWDNEGGGNTCFYAADGTNQYEVCTPDNSTDTLNTWYHIAVVYDNSGTAGSTIYLNGTPYNDYESGNPGTIGNLTNVSRALCLGGDTNLANNCQPSIAGTGSWFYGLMDEVKIYKYTRTPGQIIEDMNAGHPAPGSPVGSAVAEWHFDEGYGSTAYDSSENGNDLTLSQAFWTNNGKFGKAFSNTNDVDPAWLTRADDPDFDFTGTDDFTISVWFKSASSTNPDITNRYIVSKPQNFAGQGEWQIGFTVTNAYPIFRVSDNGFDYDTVTVSTDYYDSSWHNIVAVKTGTTKMEIFIDGQLKGTQNTITRTGTYANSQSLVISDYNGSWNSDEFFGDIDEIQIFRSALTIDQVKQLYNQGVSSVFGATSTDSSGNATWSSANEYCPPGQGSACTAPVAEWKLDEKTGTTANDTAGNANTGTLTNGPVWKSQGVCKSGACLDFDGGSGMAQDDYVNAGSGTTIDNIFDGGGTISAWVNPRSLGEASQGRILAKSNSLGWYLWVSSSMPARLNFSSSWSGTDGDWYVASALPQNQWSLVTVAYNSDTYSNTPTIYVNGVAKTLTTTNQPTNGNTRDSDASSTLFIGNNGTGASSTFDGLIDQVRMYDYIRSQAQVAWEYNRGGPIAHWKFDECTGTTANDSSGNGLSGTIDPGDASGDNDTVGTCSSGVTTEMWNDGTSGKRNASLGFDNINDIVTVADNDVFSFGNGTTDRPFTLAAWVKESSADSNFTIIQKYSLGDTEYRFRVLSDNLTIELYDDSAGASYIGRQYSAAFSATNWTHVVAVYDGSGTVGGIDLYINGNAVDDTDRIGGTYTSMENTIQGVDIGETFNGQVDEVKVFNYTLTTQQIKNEYNNGAVLFD